MHFVKKSEFGSLISNRENLHSQCFLSININSNEILRHQPMKSHQMIICTLVLS